MRHVVRLIIARRGFAIAALAQGLQYGSGLLLLPIVVNKLSAAEVGLWYVFIAAQGLSAVVDFGFQPTIARYVSLAWSGASSFGDAGKPAMANTGPNLALLGNLLVAARQLYAILASGLFATLAIGGSIYILSLARLSGLDPTYVMPSWLLFSAATACGVYFLWIPALLLGLGRIGENYTFLVLSRGGSALFGIVALFLGGGLIGLSSAFLIAQIVSRAGGAIFLADIPLDKGTASTGRSGSRSLLREIGPNAARLGLVGVGAFLITRLNVFAVSSFYGLTHAASFSINLQMLMAVTTIAQLPAQMSLSQIVKARVAHDQHTLSRIAKRSVLGFFVIALSGSIAVVLLAPYLLHYLKSSIPALSLPSLLLLVVVVILEGNHSLHAFLITTANKVPFVIPAIVSGIAVAAMVTISCWLGLGIIGVIAAQGLVQAAYNNWKWPVMFWKDLSL